MKSDLKHIASALAQRLQAIDYNGLPISQYNKSYIGNLKPALGYFMQIYADCLAKGISTTGLVPSEITCIDYGGGSGFLSMLAKEAGIGRVVYIDLNPNSVATIKLLKQETGLGPDIILHGDSAHLAEWCLAGQIKPQLLIATDLIEHVYDLNSFFSDLTGINNTMHMIFSTASTPFNPYVGWKLRKAMTACETGKAESPNYYTKRYAYIKAAFPDLSDQEAALWSRHTRGLIYPDIERAVRSQRFPTPADACNTCDPATGNWTERILPISAYRQILSAFDYRVSVEKGFYNTERSSKIVSLACKVLNGMIRLAGQAGLYFSPFIILRCSRKQPQA